MMNKQAERKNYCDDFCNHVYRCSVHWGAECKRQGGKRIPRMKSVPNEFLQEPAEPRVETQQTKRNRIKEVLNTVRTKAAGW